MAISITINGEVREFDLDPDTPLLWALRDGLNLTGTKFGCGMNRCGACTVHVDGRARRSCILPIKRLDGKSVTTIEGLSADGTHPVQVAWQKLNVPQCGYCQSGQIMSASALLADNPEPTDDDIDGAMQVNLCRCGTYQRVRAAIHEAAGEMAQGSGSSTGTQPSAAAAAGEVK